MRVTTPLPQRRQIRHDVFQLLRIQQRLRSRCTGYPMQTRCATVRRHDALRVECGWIDQSLAQLPGRPAFAGACKIGCEVALETFLRDRSGVAQQAQPELPVRDDRPAAHRVSSRLACKRRHRLPDRGDWQGLRLRRSQPYGQRQYATRSHEAATGHAFLRSWFLSGNVRIRLPVAAKMAFNTAGAATAMVGSPTPPQKPPDGMMTVSTAGMSLIFTTG